MSRCPGNVCSVLDGDCSRGDVVVIPCAECYVGYAYWTCADGWAVVDDLEPCDVAPYALCGYVDYGPWNSVTAAAVASVGLRRVVAVDDELRAVYVPGRSV